MIQNATALLLRKLRIDHKDFITDNELKSYCKTFELDYTYISRYYQRRGVFVRIFRGIFYIKSAEEIDMRRDRYNHLELVAKGLELKGGDILPRLTRGASRFSDRSYHCWQSSDLHGREFGSAPPYLYQSHIADIYCGIQVTVQCETAYFTMVNAI